MEQTSIEFIPCSFVVSLFVPKIWDIEKIGGSNTFATDGTYLHANKKLAAPANS